jgi:alkylation response protein AidB-like acyl-CoA dehydrogenase
MPIDLAVPPDVADLAERTATRVVGGWRIDGRKWYPGGARGAAFVICVAPASGSPGDRGWAAAGRAIRNQRETS